MCKMVNMNYPIICKKSSFFFIIWYFKESLIPPPPLHVNKKKLSYSIAAASMHANTCKY